MTEDSQQPQQPQQPQQAFEIQKIYLKDASFESPSSPAVFSQEINPESNLELHTSNRKLAENVYEVEVSITLTLKAGEQVVYLIEIKEAGVFGAMGYTDEQLGHLLGSFCPNLIYPFAREVVSDLVVKGGFPQMLLAPINFDALYMQHMQEKAQKEQATTKH